MLAPIPWTFCRRNSQSACTSPIKSRGASQATNDVRDAE